MADDFKDIEQKIEINYDTNAEKTAKSIDKLDNSMESVQDTQKKERKISKKS